MATKSTTVVDLDSAYNFRFRRLDLVGVELRPGWR